jgi:hypothetical protein
MIHPRFRCRLDGFYSLLNNPLELVPGIWKDNVRFYAPMIGEREKRYGVIVTSSYDPAEWLQFKLIYAWNETYRDWSDNSPPSTINFEPESRFASLPFTGFPDDDVLPFNNVKHTVHITNNTCFKSLWDINLQVDYWYYSGRPYFPIIEEKDGDDPPTVNRSAQLTGPDWNRMDFSLVKRFLIKNQFSIQTGLICKNVFNSWQDPEIDPATGAKALDPYSADSPLPRTIELACQFNF